MKKLLIFFISFICINLYAEGATAKYTTGNVTVYISSFSYREEMNKGIIIAESVRELSQMNNYNDSIHIYLEMTLNKIPLYVFKGKNSIFLHTQSHEFNVLDHLKLMEYAINRKTKIEKNLNYTKIINRPNSDKINKLLKIRINRPTIIEELKNKSFYSYYYQNDRYYFYNLKTNEALVDVNSVYYFTTVVYFRPLIFIDESNFYYENLKGDLNFVSFPKGTKLTENYRMKEISHFVILYVYKKDIEDFTLAILDLDKNVLKEISTPSKGPQY